MFKTLVMFKRLNKYKEKVIRKVKKAIPVHIVPVGETEKTNLKLIFYINNLEIKWLKPLAKANLRLRTTYSKVKSYRKSVKKVLTVGHATGYNMYQSMSKGSKNTKDLETNFKRLKHFNKLILKFINIKIFKRIKSQSIEADLLTKAIQGKSPKYFEKSKEHCSTNNTLRTHQNIQTYNPIKFKLMNMTN
jgi:hypothetical protein